MRDSRRLQWGSTVLIAEAAIAVIVALTVTVTVAVTGGS